MRKEITYAAISGIFFGLVIAFGAWKANASLKTRKNATLPPSQKTPSPQVPGTLSLTYSKPNDLSVLSQKTAQIIGLTKPQSWVVLSGEEEDSITQAKEDGSFAGDINLIAGVNTITITALDDGNQIANRLTLIYSTEFTSPETPTSKPTPSTTPDPIRKKVEEKIESVSKYPTSILGTITDLPEGTIQISQFSFDQSIKGEIKQISVNGDTTFIKTGKENKTIKVTDLALGDFIVAMGYINGNTVLRASRVLVTTPPTLPTLKILQGEITESGKNNFFFLPKNSNEVVEITIPKGSKIKTSTLEENTKAIIITTEKEKVLLIRSFFPTP